MSKNPETVIQSALLSCFGDQRDQGNQGDQGEVGDHVYQVMGQFDT